MKHDFKIGDIVQFHYSLNTRLTGVVKDVKEDIGHGYVDIWYKIQPYNSDEVIGVEESDIKALDKQYYLDCRFLRMALIWSENSYAIRRKVGCLIVNNKMIISDGYNGTPSGFPNVCEDEVFTDDPNASDANSRLVTKPEVLHAEANAITKLAKSNNSSEGATIYITDEPCIDCSKLIIQSGIVRVVYVRDYRIHAGIELLQKAGIKVRQITMDELGRISHETECSVS